MCHQVKDDVDAKRIGHLLGEVVEVTCAVDMVNMVDIIFLKKFF